MPDAPPDEKEAAGDFLSGADFGERTEGRWIEIQCKRFLVAVEFFSGRHSHVPVERTSQEARGVRDELAKLEENSTIESRAWMSPFRAVVGLKESRTRKMCRKPSRSKDDLGSTAVLLGRTVEETRKMPASLL